MTWHDMTWYMMIWYDTIQYDFKMLNVDVLIAFKGSDSYLIFWT